MSSAIRANDEGLLRSGSTGGLQPLLKDDAEGDGDGGKSTGDDVLGAEESSGDNTWEGRDMSRTARTYCVMRDINVL